MSKRLVIAVLALVLSFTLVFGVWACAKPAPAPVPAPAPKLTPKPEVIKWVAQNLYAGTTFKEIGGQTHYLAEKVKNLTNGRLIIDVMAPGAVVPAKEVFSAVSKGTIQAAIDYYPGYHTGIMPEANIEIGMPYAWSTQWEAADAFMNYGLLERFREIYAEHNIYYLTPIFYDATYAINTNFPISSPEDLKGKKIRATGVYGDFVKSFGGSPTVIPWGEMYMALKLGTVDAAIMGVGALETEKLQEVFTHSVTVPNINCVVGCQLVSMDAWNALPADIKLILSEVAIETATYFQVRYSAGEKHILLNAVNNYGIEQVSLTGAAKDKAIAAGVALWDKMAAKSPRSAELVEIVKKQARDLGKIK